MESQHPLSLHSPVLTRGKSEGEDNRIQGLVSRTAAASNYSGAC